jgi:hypothetical protein
MTSAVTRFAPAIAHAGRSAYGEHHLNQSSHKTRVLTTWLDRDCQDSPQRRLGPFSRTSVRGLEENGRDKLMQTE